MKQIDKILIIVLSSLIILDFATTIVAVGYLGAIELNPVVSLGFMEFMIIKVLITVLSILVLIYINSTIKTDCLVVMVIFYGTIIISNVYQLISGICF